MAGIGTICDAQFPPGRFPGAPGSDSVPDAELEAGRTSGLLWAAEVEGNVVGFALAAIHETVLHLRQIAVLPEFQRRGIGTALISLISDEAVRRGLSDVSLTTFEDIPWNAPLYRNLGFRILKPDETPDFLADELAAEKAAGMKHRVAMARTAGNPALP